MHEIVAEGLRRVKGRKPKGTTVTVAPANCTIPIPRRSQAIALLLEGILHQPRNRPALTNPTAMVEPSTDSRKL